MTGADLENAAFDGKIKHTDACDLLFAEFQVYSQEQTSEHHDPRNLRECSCEDAFRPGDGTPTTDYDGGDR